MGISPQDFEKMRERLAKPRPRPSPAAAVQGGFNAPQIVLGIDPSLRSTGYGVIRLGKPHPQALDHGAIPCPTGWEHSRCLVRITQVLREVIKKHRPQACAIEGLFFAQNMQTALIMGEARGAALVAAGEAGLDIFEVAPRKVKQAIVGFGAAQKTAVATMVQRMLRLAEPPQPDAADALALALTLAQETNRYSLTPRKKI